MSEKEFIRRLLNKKTREKSFSYLLDLYQERLYWQIRKLVITHENANDVLQNTFVRIYRGLSNFKQKSSLHTWMYRIAYNESVRFLEIQQKKQVISIDAIGSKYLEGLFEDVFFDGNQVQKKLQELLLQLPEKQRHIFQMKYYDDLKFREIAEIINIPENTIKTNYYTAVKFIEKYIVT